jgi:hypothetical protein
VGILRCGQRPRRRNHSGCKTTSLPTLLDVLLFFSFFFLLLFLPSTMSAAGCGLGCGLCRSRPASHRLMPSAAYGKHQPIAQHANYKRRDNASQRVMATPPLRIDVAWEMGRLYYHGCTEASCQSASLSRAVTIHSGTHSNRVRREREHEREKKSQRTAVAETWSPLSHLAHRCKKAPGLSQCGHGCEQTGQHQASRLTPAKALQLCIIGGVV